MAAGAIDPETPPDQPPDEVVPGGNAGKLPAGATAPPTVIPGIDGSQQPVLRGGGAREVPGSIDQPQKGGKPQVQTVDTSNLKYDDAKLKKAQNTLDVLDALKPKSRNEYMAAWEKQYGAINDHFDQLQKQLGTRPTDQGMSKKEKFAALLEFGLHLMKNSATPTPNQGAVLSSTLSDSIEGAQKQHQATVAGQQGAYDNKQQAINAGRSGELQKLGTMPQAVDKQSTIDQRDASAARDIAGAAKDLEGGNPLVIVDDKGKQWEKSPGDAAWKPSVGIDGKSISRPIGTGSRGGAAHASVYQESLAEFDKRNPLPDNPTPAEKLNHDMAALAYAKGKSTVDTSIYEKARTLALRGLGTRSNYPGSSEDYVNEVRAQTADIYDRMAGGSPSNLGGPKTPAQDQSPHGGPEPAAPGGSALVGLKPGFQRHLSDGSIWTMGIDGKPHNLRPPSQHQHPTLQ